MKRAPLRLWLVLALFCSAGILKATLPPITIGNWTATSSLSQMRANGATVRLNDGRILFTGGDNGSGAVQSTEFFNADGTVTSAGAMNVARSQHFAVVMSDGRVLVGGGNSSGGGTTNSAEIYDPGSGNWTSTSPLNSARANATAALLQDGRVVIAGGDNAGAANNTMEVYDPSSDTFSVVSGTMSSPRTKHAMAVLESGQVLIIGGFDGTNALASTDVFDPAAGSIAAGPALAIARYSATATTLLNGQVAVIGGAGSNGKGGTTDLSSMEIFDPTAGAFTTLSAKLAIARAGHQAYLLPNNNNVLITGGTSGGTALASSELFSAQASSLDGSWGYSVSATGAMTVARAAASGAANQTNGPYSVVPPMPGLVIVGGGADPSGRTLASTEVYGYPTVQTDQSDYPPGTNVHIQGSGFQPNENVTITLVESPLFDTHGPYTVQADGNGNISNSSFTTDVHDENVRFWLSAAGSQSGVVAENTFTDATATNTTLTSSPNPSAVNQSFTLTATVRNGNSQGSGTLVTVGTVDFYNQTGITNPNCGGQTGTQLGTTQNVTASGTATISFSFPSAGTFKLGACYTGTGGSGTQNSQSPSITQIVNGATPSVMQVNPNQGPTAGGTSVTITGTNFTGATAVKFGSANATSFTVGSATSITAISPAGTGTVHVTVTTPTGTSATSAADQFAYVAAPTVTAVNPNRGPTAGGTSVTITGANFTGATAVQFGGNSATPFTVNGAGTQITTTSPAGSAGTADLTVTTGGGTSATSAADQFTYQAATTTTINAPAITYGTNGNVTVTVSSGSGTPSGNVSLAVDGGTAVSKALSSGSATFTSIDIPALGTPSAGNHSLSANYTAQGNFDASTATGTLVVNKANATVVVTPYTVTYDGQPHTATVTSITGANGETGATVGAVDVSHTTHTAAGTYSDYWTFTGTGNYNNLAATTIADTINKANATVVVTPYDVIYDTNAHTATGSGTGVVSESLLGLDLTGTTHNTAGTYVDTWNFIDLSGNYNNATGTVTDVIEKATPTITWTPPAAITYGTALSNTQLNATANVPGSFAYNPPSGVVLGAGAHQALVTLFTPADSTDYSIANATAYIDVNKATPTIVWRNPADITYGTALGDTQLNAIALPPTSALSAWFKAEGNTDDSSPAANNGTAHNLVYTAGFDGIGQAFSFDASQMSGVTVADNSAYDLNTPGFTAGFWIKGSQPHAPETILDKSYTGGTGWDFEVDTNGRLQFNIGEGNNQFAQAMSGVNVLDRNFHFVAGTWNATTNKMALYVDGVLQNTTALTAAVANNHSGLNIGFSGSGGGSSYFTGEVDEVQIFDLPLPTGIYTYTPAKGTVLNANQGQDLSVNFAPDDTTDLISATAAVKINVLKANPAVNVTPYSVTYDGNSHTASGTATEIDGGALTGLDLSGTAHTNAGTYTDTWTFTDSTGNYNNATGNVTDIINKADPQITVSGYNVTYDGNPHTATGVAKGVQGETLGGLDLSATTHTDAGTFTDGWTFTDATGNYNHASGTVKDCIKKTNATISVTPYTVTYDGNPHTATGSATGVESPTPADLSSLLHLGGTTHTNAGDYPSDAWTFDGNTNYNPASGTVHESIAKANAQITVTAYSVTYDGNSHTATGTATGVKGESLSGLDLSGTTHTNANNYTDTWNFTDVTGNYNNASGSTKDCINKANATINVIPYTNVTFDGNPHLATGSATGVKGEALAGLDLSGTTHTDAGTYTDTWKFTDTTGNYNNASSTVTDSIVPAPSFTAVTCLPNVTYNGQAQTPCSALVTGAVLSLQFTPTYINNLNAGTATASFTYTGDPNHTGSMSSANFTINPANTGTSVTSSPNPSNWMQVATITANVGNSPATNVPPVGSVNFYNAPSGATCSTLQGNTTALIGTGVLSPSADPNTSTATLATPSLPVGTDTILACYNNFNTSDPNYNNNFGASNGSTSQTVIPAPIVTLVPTSVSFGTQAAGTKSGVQSVTICNGPSGVVGASCYGVPVATATLNVSSIALGGNNPGDFIFTTSPANACGGSIAVGGSCTVNLQFAPQGGSSGVESAFLNLTDNNGNVAGSVQAASVSGAGLSTIGPVAGSVSTYAVYAMNNGCSAVTISGNGTVDNGNVGTNGNVTLTGNPVINGAVSSPFGATGSCSSKSVTGLSTSGKAQATGGINPLSGPQVYPLPPVASPAPPITNWNITSCPSGLTGCTNNGSKNVTLAPGQYGNLTVSGGTTAHVSKGTYNLNSLTLSGNSVLYVDSGPVVLNLAGALLGSNGAAMDSSGGTIVNPSGVTSNLQIYFAGSSPTKLSGGSGSYALVYAPNSAVSLTGGSHFYGSIVANTVNSSGNTAIHGDLSLASIASGDTLWFSSAGLKVQGLPASGTVKLYVTNATVSFTAAGSAYNVAVPNAVITFSSTATKASTTWDSANNRWSTLVPISSVNNNGTIHAFFDGVAFPVPANFSNGIQNVTFQAAYSTTSTGLSFNWQWGAARYNGTMPATGDYSSFSVNPLDSTVPAGTPVTYESDLLFGDLGPGFVGMYQGSAGVVPTIAPASIAPSSFNFGAVTKTQPSLPMVFTLTNNQSGTLTMGSGMPATPPVIAITGTNAADFSFMSSCPAAGATLSGGGGSCTVTVTFTPSTTGAEKAKLSVYDDAPNSPQTVFLTGTGQ